jgi:hypothetical protein
MSIHGAVADCHSNGEAFCYCNEFVILFIILNESGEALKMEPYALNLDYLG